VRVSPSSQIPTSRKRTPLCIEYQHPIRRLVDRRVVDVLPLFNIRCSDDAFDTGVTPCDTEWTFGPTQSGNPGPITARNHANLSFASFVNALNAAVGDNALRFGPGVLHLISDDIYLDIQFTSWTQGNNGGGFRYVRSTPAQEPVPEPPSATLFVLGALAAAGSAARQRK
jgi:hypothetical protein